MAGSLLNGKGCHETNYSCSTTPFLWICCVAEHQLRGGVFPGKNHTFANTPGYYWRVAELATAARQASLWDQVSFGCETSGVFGSFTGPIHQKVSLSGLPKISHSFWGPRNRRGKMCSFGLECTWMHCLVGFSWCKLFSDRLTVICINRMQRWISVRPAIHSETYWIQNSYIVFSVISGVFNAWYNSKVPSIQIMVLPEHTSLLQA